MSRIDTADTRKFFAVISVAFWLGVALIAVISAPVYQLMKLVIQMRAEYSLLEQMTKFLLLVMLCASLFAYSNRKEAAKVKLASLFVLFALTLYFSESNFIASGWHPLFGAFFIAVISWQLLKVDWAALAFMLLGAGFIFMGVMTDTLMDHPHWFPETPFFQDWLAIAGLIEEQFDMWGIACLTFSSLVAFRVRISRMFYDNPWQLVLLALSLGLIASGNSFVHWSYYPSPTFEVIATAMALTGVAGVMLVDRKIQERGFRLTHFDRQGVLVGILIFFVVLPVIYGGSGHPFNLLLWGSFFYYLYKLLIRSHPTFTGQ